MSISAERKGEAMRHASYFGIWTWAARYAAIGVIGVFFFSTQPNLAGSADGYGATQVVQK
jgi:hypothetical protein